MTKQHEIPSYLTPGEIGPWAIYLEQIDRVAPHLGSLSRWVETLKRPKRALIVDVPIERDDGTIEITQGGFGNRLYLGIQREIQVLARRTLSIIKFAQRSAIGIGFDDLGAGSAA